jgi:hypothetical protein
MAPSVELFSAVVWVKDGVAVEDEQPGAEQVRMHLPAKRAGQPWLVPVVGRSLVEIERSIRLVFLAGEPW